MVELTVTTYGQTIANRQVTCTALLHDTQLYKGTIKKRCFSVLHVLLLTLLDVNPDLRAKKARCTCASSHLCLCHSTCSTMHICCILLA